MKIVVLIKQVPDTGEERQLNPATGWLDRTTGVSVVDEINERALEVALRYKDVNKGTEIVALTMGPESAAQALRKALSMGADSALHVLDNSLAGADLSQTAAVLAAALRNADFDLIVAGNESTDGRGGLVPAMVAEHLGVPVLASLNTVHIAPGKVSGERAVENGTLKASAALPAVISVTEWAAEARFPNFKGIMTAKRKPLTVLSVAELGAGPEMRSGAGRSTVLIISRRPARAAGKKVFDEGNAGVELADFLVAGRLI